MEPRKALGRGLAALMPEWSAPNPDPSARLEAWQCALEEIAPSSDNPRQVFSGTQLEELSQSIRTQGLIQPLVVRGRTAEDIDAHLPPSIKYVLIAGERRWRAAAQAGLRLVPVVIHNVSPSRAFEWALVENVQRQDLNPIEEARAYHRLTSEFGYTQDQLAERVGRARETITNTLRLLRLPPPVQQQVVAGQLSMGHARALLAVGSGDTIETVAQQVIERQLSVRQTEALVKRMNQPSGPVRAASPFFTDVERQLTQTLNTRVRVVAKTKKRGRLEIHYTSLDTLDALLKKLIGSA